MPAGGIFRSGGDPGGCRARTPRSPISDPDFKLSRDGPDGPGERSPIPGLLKSEIILALPGDGDAPPVPIPDLPGTGMPPRQVKCYVYLDRATEVAGTIGDSASVDSAPWRMSPR